MSDQDLRLQRLAEFARAWSDARANYESDLAKARTTEQVAAINKNKDDHARNWADAAIAALGVNNDAIVAAHHAAKAANDAVVEAREQAEALAEIIRKSAEAARKLTEVLVASAGG